MANPLRGRLRRGSGRSGGSRYSRPSSGSIPLTGDPMVDYARLLAYREANPSTEREDTAEGDLTDTVVRLLSSPDESVREQGQAALDENLDSLDRDRLEELGVEVPAQGGNSWWDKVKSTGAKALEIIGRSGQAAMEGVQATMDATGLDEFARDRFTAGEQIATLSSADEAQASGTGQQLQEGTRALLGEGTDTAGYGSSGGFRDVWRALKGEERWDPTEGQYTNALGYDNALGVEASNYDGWAGRVMGVADFTGQAALDPLNFVGGGSGAAARSTERVAARELAGSALEELTPRLVRQLERQGGKAAATDITEEALYDALRRVGLREGLTDAQREGVTAALERSATEGTARTTRSGRQLALKGDEDLSSLRPSQLVRLGRENRSGARRVAEEQMTEALRYDRGGFRVFGRSVAPESISYPVRDALGRAPNTIGRKEIAAEVMNKAVPRRVQSLERQIDTLMEEAESGLYNADELADVEEQLLDLESRSEALRNATTAEEAIAADPGLSTLGDVRTVSRRNKVQDTLAKAFRTKDALRRSTQLSEGTDQLVKMAEELGTSTTARQARRLGARLEAAAKKVGRQIDRGEQEQILRAMGQGDILDKTEFADELGDYIDAVNDLRDTTWNMLHEYKLVDPANLGKRDTYVPRYITDEARDALKRYIRENARDPRAAEVLRKFQQFSEASTAGKQGGHLLKRSPEDAAMGLVEYNNKWKTFLQNQGYLDEGVDFVEMDAANIFARRFNEAQRSAQLMIAVDEMEKTLKGALGEDLVKRVRPGTSAADAAKIAEDMSSRGFESVPANAAGTIWVHPDLKDHVTQYSRIMDSDESVKKFGKFLDGWNRVWKSYATVPILGGTSFHTKNSIGNMFNNYLAGVTNPATYLESAKIQRALSKARKLHPDLDPVDALRAEGASERVISIVELAEERGVIDESFFSRDIMDKSRDVTERTSKTRRERAIAKINPASPDSLPGVPLGRMIGESVEDNARLSHFISKLDELGDADLAAQSVKKYLFDYGDLTPFEQKYMKRINAFYTFTRKNTPLQFSELVRNPAAINRMALLEGGLLGYGQENPNAPEWMGEIGSPASSGVSSLLSGRDNPQVFANFETPFEAAMDVVSPLRSAPVIGDRSWQDSAQELAGQFSGGPAEGIKALIVEPATGYSTFSGAPLRTPEGDFRDSPWLRTVSTVVPQAQKVVNMVNADDRFGGTSSTDSATLRAWRALTGVTAKELTDDYRDQAIRSEDRRLEELIAALKGELIEDPITGELRAPYIPTIQELQQIGVLERPTR